MKKKLNATRDLIGQIIFETNTPAARGFDVALLWAILLSVGVVMAESLPGFSPSYYRWLSAFEWIFTIIFTIEYGMRIWSSRKPLKYIFSFWGFIDLISILPTFFAFFFAGSQYFLTVRILRLLRVFRILRIGKLNRNANMLGTALLSSIPKISVFLITMVAIVTLIGSIMYVVEGGSQGFTSIPQSIYWAIVTVTTVGYGDMVPHSILGKIFSSVAMIIGYSIIAVPTGIVTAEMSKSKNEDFSCPFCGKSNPGNANFCNNCGRDLRDELKEKNEDSEQ